MKKSRLMIPVIILLTVFLSACGSSVEKLSAEEEAVCGEWAYVHDKDTTVLGLYKDRKAKYENRKYTFYGDDSQIRLNDQKGNSISFRYRMEDDGMLLYRKAEYTYDGEGEPSGLIGQWKSAENWTFQFTESGTFLEDGFFSGIYTVDEEAGTFTLIYQDQFEDTECYYSLDGNKLSIEYPWKMVRTGSK